MEGLVFGVLLLLLILCLSILGVGKAWGAEEGRKTGFASGWQNGDQQGFSRGFNDGWARGSSDGWARGFNYGYDRAKQECEREHGAVLRALQQGGQQARAITETYRDSINRLMR